MLDGAPMKAKKDDEGNEGSFHTVTFRCPKDVLELLDAQAKDEDRSRGNLIVHLLRKCLKTPPPPEE